LTSPVPVVVYVAPSGSQAASAGVFITLAAHIAAMAPGTNIGAAHPVTLEGQQDSVMMEKATNDAAAFIRTIAEKRSRNVQWAEKAVRQSLSITETEALSEKVVDLVAKNIDTLLAKIDGKTVQTEEGEKTLHTRNAEVRTTEMSWRERLLDILSSPDIAYILFMIGIYGILFELYNPGSIFPGVVGVISLILAFYSLHTLPINYAGLALIIFAVILFIAEIKITSHGLLTVAGIISLFLGSLMLFQSDSALEVVRLSWSVIIPTVLFTALFFVFALGMGIRAQRRKPSTGAEGLIGEIGETISILNPEGEIRIHGEIWHATSTEGKIPQGVKVRVRTVDNLRVEVSRTDTENS
ncbi:MAG TPA: nodulation protein NfeD, partial [Bacteroidota bacterium]